ncbi:MAG: hypothetical protein WC289_01235 [Patescibacteria group bacterium]|jgi:hypothetical protein
MESPQKPQGDLWLRIHYWTLTNSSLFKKWWVITLLGATVFFVVFGLTNVLVYAISLPREQQTLEHISRTAFDYRASRSALQPLDLVTSDATVLTGAGSTFDIAATVSNPNEHWIAAAVEYTFIVDGKETKAGRAVVAPQQESYLVVYGETLPASVGTRRATVTISHITWQRAPSTSGTLNGIFTVGKPVYAIVQDIQPARTIGTVTASVKNESLRGYWQVSYIVALYRANTLVGVNTVYVERFAGKTVRDVSAQWSPAIPVVDSIKVIPVLNVLDPSVIMAL